MGGYAYKVLKRTMGKAINHYDMISDGDNIAVGISGGKDSLTLMWMLRDRLARIPVSYNLYGIYIDPGFDKGFSGALKEYFDKSGWKLRVERTDFGPLSHSSYNRENPCFLCSRLRRKRLFEIAHELGCKKLALGHHKDDIIETFFLNICYAGEISTMIPFQPFFKGKFFVIRPLAFSDEQTIKRFAADKSFPEFINPCPSAKKSKRREIKSLLKTLYRSNKKIKGNIFRAMSHVKMEYLLK